MLMSRYRLRLLHATNLEIWGKKTKKPKKTGNETHMLDHVISGAFRRLAVTQ